MAQASNGKYFKTTGSNRWQFQSNLWTPNGFGVCVAVSGQHSVAVQLSCPQVPSAFVRTQAASNRALWAHPARFTNMKSRNGRAAKRISCETIELNWCRKVAAFKHFKQALEYLSHRNVTPFIQNWRKYSSKRYSHKMAKHNFMKWISIKSKIWIVSFSMV